MNSLKGSRQLAVISLAVMVALLLSLSWALADTSPPLEEWNSTFGGSDHEAGASVQETSDGGYIITGNTDSSGAGGADVYLVKVDSQGVEEWSRTFGGSDFDSGYSVQETSDGGYIIAGIRWSSSTGTIDAYLVKVDSQGVEEWSRVLGDSQNDSGYSVQETSDGGYIITGLASPIGATSNDVYLVKVDSQGMEEWSTTFGGSGNDEGNSVQQTSDGGYIIAGVTWSFGAGGGDVYLVKTDSHGGEEWSTTFGGSDYDVGASVQETSDGGYVIAGLHDGLYIPPMTMRGDETVYGDVYLVKVDSQGVEEWSRTFGGSDDDGGRSVQGTSDGGYVIAGWTYSFGAGRTDVYLVKVDSQGMEEWNTTFGGSSYDEGYSVQQTSDGGYIITGSTFSFGAGGIDVYLVKVDSLGSESEEDSLPPPQSPSPPLEEWNSTFGGSGGDYGGSGQETSDGGYIMTGSIYSEGTRHVYLVKTDSLGGEEWSRTLEGYGGSSVRETSDGGYIIVGATGYMEGDVYLVKTDSLGGEEWSTTFGGSEIDGGYSVQETSDGGYIIAGGTTSFGAGMSDVYLVKTDSLGGEEWSRTFGGSENDDGGSVQETSDGGYIITGVTESFGAGGWDVYLVKTDSQGREEWSTTFGGSEIDGGYSVQETSNGGYIIAGYTDSSGAGGRDVYLVKTDSLGGEEWSRTFGGSDYDYGYWVQETSDGGYIITGVTESFGAGGWDVYLVKTDSQGREEWSTTFGGSELDGGNYVQETSDGGYIITGSTTSFGAGGADFYLVKVGAQVSEREDEPITPPLPPLPPILSNLAITPAEIESGDEVTISMDIENIDSQSFTYIVTMQRGELTLLIDVELEAYESTTVSRTITQDIPGDFNVTVDGLTGSFTVKAPPKPAEFEFSNLRIFYPGVAPPEVEAGQTVTVTVSIEAENVGELEGDRTFELNVDGEVVDSKEVTLGGGASETVLFELTRGEGTYEVEVEGLTESFTVNTQPEPEPEQRGIPGFPFESIVLGLVTGILVLWLLSRSKMTF